MHDNRFRSITSYAGVAAAVALSLTACGNTVTASHDWYSFASVTSTFAPPGAGPAGTSTALAITQFNGVLTTSQSSKPVTATLVREECQRPATGEAATPYTCVLFLNAGAKNYVAFGTTFDLYGASYTLKTLTNPAASIIITPLGATPRTVHLRISARR